MIWSRNWFLVVEMITAYFAPLLRHPVPREPDGHAGAEGVAVPELPGGRGRSEVNIHKTVCRGVTVTRAGPVPGKWRCFKMIPFR